MHIRIILEPFEKYNYSVIIFLLQSTRYVSNEQPCMLKKQLDYMRIFYFYLVCFTFSISYSMLPFHLACVFQSIFYFFSVLSQAFINCNRKSLVCVCVCMCIHIIYIVVYLRKFMNFFLTKKCMTF